MKKGASATPSGAKGSSQSQSTPSGSEGTGITLRKGAPSRASASSPTPTGTSKPSRSAASAPARHNQITFYTEEAPGIKVEPLWVIVSAAVFVGVVVLLHLWGKMSS